MGPKKVAVAAVEEVPTSPAFDLTHYVKLISGDGTVFFADRNCAKVSKLIQSCLDIILNNVRPNTPSTMLPSHEVTIKFASIISSNTSAGLLTIPEIQIHFLNSLQLEEALRFGYFKYRYDGEAVERRAPFLFSPLLDHLEIASIGMLLQM